MASAGSTTDGRARVYALASPGALFRERDAVAKAVYAALGVTPSAAYRLTLSESSGWLEFTAVEQLWDRKVAPALPDRAAALRAAETALAALARSCSSANKQWPDAVRDIALFPPSGLLRRAQLSVVPRPDGSAWDHWLYRAEPRLYLDGGARGGSHSRGSAGTRTCRRSSHPPGPRTPSRRRSSATRWRARAFPSTTCRRTTSSPATWTSSRSAPRRGRSPSTSDGSTSGPRA
jgi:hypothetical protein